MNRWGQIWDYVKSLINLKKKEPEPPLDSYSSKGTLIFQYTDFDIFQDIQELRRRLDKMEEKYPGQLP